MKLSRALRPPKLLQAFVPILCAATLVSTTHAQPAKRKNVAPTPSPSPSASPGPSVANSLTADESAFLQNAWATTATKLKLVNLALQNTQSKAVRDFANRQLQEHTQAYNSLKGLAKNCDVQLTPRTADSQEAYESLSKLHGPDFDQAYLAMAVEMYTQELDTTKKAQASAKNAEFKKYMEADVPRIESRLQAAKDALANLGAAKK